MTQARKTVAFGWFRLPCRERSGLEEGRFGAHIPGMSKPRYEIHEADDGTFTVEVYDGVGADAVITNFDSKKQAEDWIADERRKLGIDGRWQAID
jgi:hypothetical protein